MAESHVLGQKGESLAATYLEDAGYKIRHKNWKSGRKELDIVAENKDFIVFAEVKTRTGNFPEQHPGELVSREKQRMIQFAAEDYIKKYEITKENRFDVIIIKSSGRSMEVEHIPYAFYPALR
jgi:putative endonuclease